jgi:hypothetical protein
MFAVAFSFALSFSFAVRAQESLDEIDAKPAAAAAAPAEAKAGAQVNGYIDNRFSYSLIDPATPAPTQDVPSLLELAEANLQLRVDLGAATRFAYLDLSLFYQGGWLFYSDDGNGGRKDVANHDVPGLRPFIVPSELFVSVTPRPWLSLLAGKKRITWGSGFAFNPTDLVNPPKDPTDPNFQRSGNWIARIEAPFRRFTVSALFAPQALYSQDGIPYAMMKYPEYPPSDSRDSRDDQYHYLVALRLYALLFDADFNFVYYFSNYYQDVFANKSRFGISFSRYFFTDWELHVEALLQQGSARLFPDHQAHTLTARKLESDAFQPRLILGTRRQFSDESLLSIEYYYQADGYSDQEFEDLMRLLAGAKAAGLSAAPTMASQMGGALPQKFAFEPLRRHYLIASYTKPRIRDDWTLGAVLIAGLRDLSGLFSASVAWTPREWLTLTLYAYVPIRGLGVGEAKVGNQSFSEYSILPYDFRALFEARAFY